MEHSTLAGVLGDQIIRSFLSHLQELRSPRQTQPIVTNLQEQLLDPVPDAPPEDQEGAVDPVEDSLDQLSLSQATAAQQVKETAHKLLVYGCLESAGVEVRMLQDSQEDAVAEV